MVDYSGWLFDWFRKRSPQVHLSVEDNYFDAGAIDSFGVIELIEDMECNLEVKFTQDDFYDRRFFSISGLSEILTEKSGVIN